MIREMVCLAAGFLGVAFCLWVVCLNLDINQAGTNLVLLMWVCMFIIGPRR